MPELLRMPEVAANAATATLAEWLVGEKESYVAQEPIAVIETDKAVVDLNVDTAGVVLRTLVAAGTEVAVGDPIALIGGADEVLDDIDTALSGLLSGEIGPAPASGGAPAAAPDAQPDAPPASGGALAADRTAVPSGPERVFASPLARRLARQAGLSTEAIRGTGPGGRIVRGDVERALAERAASPAVAPVPAPDSAPASTASASAGIDAPVSRMRSAIAQRLSESKQTVPHFYVSGSLLVDELFDLRARVNGSSPVKISVNDLLVKAVAAAHRAVPEMNVIWAGNAIRSFATVDIGVAVATGSGLVTPVLRSVDRMPLSAVSAAVRDFAERARQGRLRQEELEGGTCTVTNLGMFGVEEFSAIINPPQASILAVGATRQEAVVDAEGRIGVKKVLRFTLSVDHRPVDGVVAARWAQALTDIVAHPLRMLI